jgi:hypothetical protein
MLGKHSRLVVRTIRNTQQTVSQNAEFMVTNSGTYRYHGAEFINCTVNVPHSCHRAQFTNFAAGGRNTYNETKCTNVRVCVTYNCYGAEFINFTAGGTYIYRGRESFMITPTFPQLIKNF